MKKITMIMIACTSFVLYSLPASATCGVEVCPLASHIYSQGSQAADWHLRATALQVEYPVGSGSNSYSALQTRVEYRGIDRTSLGLMVPALMVNNAGHRKVGLGNPVIFAEYRLVEENQLIVSMGSQLALPVGSTHSGIASHHFEVLPYLGAIYNTGSWYAFGNAGYLQSFGGHHDDAGAVSSINLNATQHSESEVVYRAGAGYLVSAINTRVEIFTIGQAVIEDDTNSDRYFQTAGAGFRIALGQRYELYPTFSVPLTAAKRVNYSASLGFMARI